MKINDSRMITEKIIWFATVKPTGLPHLVPVWFLYKDELIYIFTPCKSVKAKNLDKSPGVAISLETGSNPLVLEGTANFIKVPYPQLIIEQYKTKYPMSDVTENGMTFRGNIYNCLLEIEPKKIVMG